MSCGSSVSCTRALPKTKSWWCQPRGLKTRCVGLLCAARGSVRFLLHAHPPIHQRDPFVRCLLAVAFSASLSPDLSRVCRACSRLSWCLKTLPKSRVRFALSNAIHAHPAGTEWQQMVVFYNDLNKVARGEWIFRIAVLWCLPGSSFEAAVRDLQGRKKKKTKKNVHKTAQHTHIIHTPLFASRVRFLSVLERGSETTHLHIRKCRSHLHRICHNNCCMRQQATTRVAFSM